MEYEALDSTVNVDPLYEEPEILELGLSHQVISDEVYLPSHPSRDWIRCCVAVGSNGCFR